jgi:DNA-binding CsgD family transcriptional regulator
VVYPSDALPPPRASDEPGRDDPATRGLSEPLTRRELEVLRLLARGLTNQQLAAVLGISEHTVKFHVSSVLGKLGAQSRAEAVALGYRLGLVSV